MLKFEQKANSRVESEPKSSLSLNKKQKRIGIRPILPLALLVLLFTPVTPGCGGSPIGKFCSVPALDQTFSDPAPELLEIAEIVSAKCLSCHQTDGIGPIALDSSDAIEQNRQAIGSAIQNGSMPPWLPSSCCSEFLYDRSLSDDEKLKVLHWASIDEPVATTEEQKLEVESALAVTPNILSRVDHILELPEPYLPQASGHGGDDHRCFLVDWPFKDTRYVTGFNPLPDKRAIVHHLLVSAVSGDSIKDLKIRDQSDPRPGFDCREGLGMLQTNLLGGGLVGSDLPRGIGMKIEAGSMMLINIHYSMAHAAAELDNTKVALKLDLKAREYETYPIMNPIWMVDEAMKIEAGEKDATFFFHYNPALLSGGKTFYIQSVYPHMHAYGSRFAVRVLKKNRKVKQCALEIPAWEFGWEQSYWLKDPIKVEPEDNLYVECQFDNSKPPKHSSSHSKNRDIAWGDGDQEMCVALLGVTKTP